MKVVYKYADKIKGEIKCARGYAELYAIAKSNKQIKKSKILFDMAHDEIKHASNLLSLFSDDIVALEENGFLSDRDKEIWEAIGREYVESIGVTKKILE